MDLSKYAFIPLYEALVRLQPEYGTSAYSPSLVADINHLEQIQRLATRLLSTLDVNHSASSFRARKHANWKQILSEKDFLIKIATELSGMSDGGKVFGSANYKKGARRNCS